MGVHRSSTAIVPVSSHTCSLSQPTRAPAQLLACFPLLRWERAAKRLFVKIGLPTNKQRSHPTVRLALSAFRCAFRHFGATDLSNTMS